MKRIVTHIALAALVAACALIYSAVAHAGPCDVAGAIPNCEAVLAGRAAPAPYSDTSKLNYGTAEPQTLAEVPNNTEFEAPGLTPDQVGLQQALSSAQYGQGIADRAFDRTLNDLQRRIDTVKSHIYSPMRH